MFNNFLGLVASMVGGSPANPCLDANGAVIGSCQHGFHASKACTRGNCPHKVDMSDVDDTDSQAETVDYGDHVQYSASEAGRNRSNSEDSSGELLLDENRDAVDVGASSSSFSTSMSPHNAEYTSCIAVFSRESSENFARGYGAKILADDHNRVIPSSRSAISDAEVDKKLSLCPTSIVNGGLEDQVQALFLDKTLPHIIAVIEGAEDPGSLINIAVNFGVGQITLPYEKLPFMQGTNAALRDDNKQSITLYRRIDLAKAYEVGEVTVPHGAESIKCAGVRYRVGKEIFETLIVHMPNKFVGSDDLDIATIKSFKNYAMLAALGKPAITVTSFIGDTNFKKQRQENSALGIGGKTSDGGSINPQCSSSSSPTHFMQAISLGFGKSHVVLKPSQLNNVLLPAGKKKIAIDHPSFMHRTGHRGRIEDREPSKLTAWYGF